MTLTSAVRTLLLAPLLLAGSPTVRGDERPRPFEIQILDADTGRGIPLVELETVHNVRSITDNAGRIAYDEPAHAGESIFFSIHAHGYEIPKDGFGTAGVRFTVEPGKRGEVKLKRRNIAERLYRLTGQDLYRDSVVLGHETPLRRPNGSGRVAGQDSTLAVPYRDRIYWFWGDTNRLSYPLGIFRTAGATTPLPGRDGTGLKPEVAIEYDYFVDKEGFARNMVEVEDPKGVVWIDGVATVPDASGRERLVARFSRREGLSKGLEQGMVLYNDDRELFEVATNIPLSDEWRFLRDHPTLTKDGAETFLASGNPFPVTRVPNNLDDVLKPESYRSWSCVEPGADPAKSLPRRDAQGKLDWRWQTSPPVSVKDEARWIKEKRIRSEEAYFHPVDLSKPERLVTPHTGTVQWNPHRQRWVLIVVELTMDKESPSMLGEVWYSEAKEPHGPFRKAVKILSHDKQTFYNPVHHPFFDQEGGRRIYFEGTYCNTFTNSPATQRYNYNQMLYRLDLDDERLKKVFDGGE